MKRVIWAVWGLVALHGLSASTRASEPDPRWGLLANQGLSPSVMKTTLFFPGQARDGSQAYECWRSSNLHLYTVYPADYRHLNWSANAENRVFAIDEMHRAGINVVAMSSWGESFQPCNSGWRWAPMQTSHQSHNELFDAVAGKNMLILPFIESHADWQFRSEFPTMDGQVAPGTVSQINDLVNRYLKNPSRPDWASRWARVHDRNGEERYAVAIIHASSNRLGAAEHAEYAQGFATVAQAVHTATGIKVGFFLDALPPGTYAPGIFKPSPEATGPHLRQESSVLGIMCFIPEIWVGSSNDQVLIDWKRDFSRRWVDTGLPFIMDVSPGYDGHIVFPDAPMYGLNPGWTAALSEMAAQFGQGGLIFNSWNGYTEGMAAVPTQQFGDTYYQWLRFLNSTDLTTHGSVRARYLVNLGKPFGDTASTGAVTPTGLYEYVSAGGNGAPWFVMNNGLVNPLDPIPGSANTYRGSNPDFVGYRFKLPVASITRIDFYNTTYADGGTFAATPQVQYLTAWDGTWENVTNVSWNPPYNPDFAPGNELRTYEITVNQAVNNVWGIRLIGDGNPAGNNPDDPTGWVGVAELTVHGTLVVGSLDLTNNLAAGGLGVTPIGNAFQFPAANLVNGDLNNYTTTWDPGQLHAEDYFGVLWDSPKENVAALGMVFKWFQNGGLFDECRASLRIEYTTDSLAWQPVTGLDKGRYPEDSFELLKIRWQVESGYLFTFDPVPLMTGIRIIGVPHGYGRDVDGFIGATLLEVFASTAP